MSWQAGKKISKRTSLRKWPLWSKPRIVSSASPNFFPSKGSTMPRWRSHKSSFPLGSLSWNISNFRNFRMVKSKICCRCWKAGKILLIGFQVFWRVTSCIWIQRLPTCDQWPRGQRKENWWLSSRRQSTKISIDYLLMMYFRFVYFVFVFLTKSTSRVRPPLQWKKINPKLSQLLSL